MEKFIKKTLIFLSPFIILIILEVIIDPYNYFSTEKNKEIISIKKDIAFKKNPYLYTLIEYDRDPDSIIILGDSRAQKLLPQFFESYTNEKVSNLAGGGGSMQDVIKIFWDVEKKKKLKKVYIGVSIETYSGTLLKDRVTPSLDIKNSVAMYLLNKFTLETTMLICKSKLFNKKIEIEKPPFTRDDFWKRQLEEENRYLKNYSYPKNYYNDLNKVADYCLKNNISLVLFISPTHTDLQSKIQEFKLDSAYKKFKEDMKLFGDLYDFNLNNELTKNKDNFSDPFHNSDSVSRIMIKEMSLNKPEFSEFTKHKLSQTK